MTQQIIDIGVLPNDGTGDPLRVAFEKINNNFSEVYGEISSSGSAAGPSFAVQYKGTTVFTSIAYSNGVWLTFTENRFSVSSDGVNWVENLSPTTKIVRSVAACPTGFIAVGDDGLIMTSNLSGTIWAIQTSGVSYNLKQGFWDSNKNQYIVVGDSGVILTSSDGLTWTPRISGVSTTLHGIAYNINGYVIVGPANNVLFSVDSINWVPQASGTPVVLYDVLSNGNSFVAVGASGTVLTSSNGMTWVPHLTGTSQSLVSIARGVIGSTVWMVAVGGNGELAVCSDGIGSAWSDQSIGTTDQLIDIAYGNGLFYTVSPYGNMYTTDNVVVWSEISTPGSFNGSAAFIFNDISNTLQVTNIAVSNISVSGVSNLNNVSNVRIFGGNNGQILTTNGSGNLTWANASSGTPGGSNGQIQFNNNGAFGGSSELTFNSSTGTFTANLIVANTITGNLNGNANVANTVSSSAQPNITSVGTLTSLSVSGNVVAGNLEVDLATANYLSVMYDAIINGNVDFENSPNVTLGNISNVHLSGGNAGYVLATDGTGNLEWISVSATAGGSNTQIQFNDDGALAGSANLTYDRDNEVLTLNGTLGANTFQIGSGAFKFCTQRVYFATTTSMTIDQELWSVPAANVSAIDFTIISTDTTDGTRQITKITASILDTQVVFTEYAGLMINGGVGSFRVDYEPPNITDPAKIVLLVSPDSSHLTNYNMLIVEYDL